MNNIISIEKRKLWLSFFTKKIYLLYYFIIANTINDVLFFKLIRKRELNYQAIFWRFEIFFILDEIINWIFFFYFISRINRILDFVKNVIQRNFKINRDIVNILNRQNRLFRVFRDRTKIIISIDKTQNLIFEYYAIIDILNTNTQLIIRDYLFQVINNMKIFFT